MTNKNYASESVKFVELVRVASAFRIPLIQIREKHISARRLYELAVSTMKVTRSSSSRILVNDRMDIAVAANADGVHLTSKSVPSEIIRRNVRDDFLVGVSTHSIDEVTAAERSGADLAVLGPVFETPGKGRPVELEQFRLAAFRYPEFPVLALGGIDDSNYHDVLNAGAAGFAAIRFLNNVQNLEKLSLEFGL